MPFPGLLCFSYRSFEHKKLEHRIATESLHIPNGGKQRKENCGEPRGLLGTQTVLGMLKRAHVPYERGHCCACNAGSVLGNHSFGLAPMVAETLPQHRHVVAVSTSCRQEESYEFRGLLEKMGFSLSKQLPCFQVFFTLSCFVLSEY